MEQEDWPTLKAKEKARELAAWPALEEQFSAVDWCGSLEKDLFGLERCWNEEIDAYRAYKEIKDDQAPALEVAEANLEAQRLFGLRCGIEVSMAYGRARLLEARLWTIEHKATAPSREAAKAWTAFLADLLAEYDERTQEVRTNAIAREDEID